MSLALLRLWVIELAACSALGASQRGGYGAACSDDDRCARACVRACSMRVAWLLSLAVNKIKANRACSVWFRPALLESGFSTRRDVVAGPGTSSYTLKMFLLLASVLQTAS